MATSPLPPSSHLPLTRLFRHVLSLEAFIARWLLTDCDTDLAVNLPAHAASNIDRPHPHGLALIEPTDSIEFAHLVQGLVVATDTLPESKPYEIPPTPCRSQHSLVTQCIALLLEQHHTPGRNVSWDNLAGPKPILGTNRKPAPLPAAKTTTDRNLLIEGYRYRTAFSQSSLRDLPMVECYAPNTLVNFVKTRPWQLLLDRIGEPAMTYLLTQTSIFVQLPRRNWCQITGPSVHSRCHQLNAHQVMQPSLEYTQLRTSQLTSADLIHHLEHTQTLKPSKRQHLVRQLVQLDDKLGNVPFNAAVGSTLKNHRKRKRRTEAQPKDAVTVATNASTVLPLTTTFFDRKAMFFRRPRHHSNGQPLFCFPRGHLLNVCTVSGQPVKTNCAAHTIFGTTFTQPLPATRAYDWTLKRTSSAEQSTQLSKHLGRTNSSDQVHLTKTTSSTHTLGAQSRRRRRQRQKQLAMKTLGIPLSPQSAPAHGRLHWRVRLLRSHIESLLRRHKRCNYRAILDRWCPSQPPNWSLSMAASSTVHSLTKDLSTPLPGGVLKAPEPTVPNAYPIAQCPATSSSSKEQSTRPNVLRQALCSTQVISFIHTCLVQVVPPRLWGSKRNKQAILGFIGRFITASRHCTFSLHDMMARVKLTDCTWLGTAQSTARHATPLERQRRTQILASFLWWLMEGFVIPLVANCFYVTDAAETRQQLLYYRHDDWKRWTRAPLAHLLATMFQPLSAATTATTERRLPFASVRLMPKSTGVRLIMNLRRPGQLPKIPPKPILSHNGPVVSMATRSEPSINSSLRNAFAILSAERHQQPHRFASSTFGLHDVYQRLTTYKAHWQSQHPRKQFPRQFFLVKLDVQGAFDHIPHTKLMDAIRTLLSEDEYLLQRYQVISGSQGRLRVKYRKQGRSVDDFIDFPTFAAQQAQTYRRSIWIDQVYYPCELQSETISLLHEHIERNWAMIQDRPYQQTVGIPQGSILSSLLCSLFFGVLENQHLATILTSGDALLLRLTDDFLLITPHQQEAVQFYQCLARGFPEYGCTINPCKTRVNFDINGRRSGARPYAQSAADSQADALATRPLNALPYWFPWCGLLIHSQTLDVRGDYTRYTAVPLRHTLTVPTRQQMGQFLVTKLTGLLRVKLVDIMLHPALFTKSLMPLVNIYENFALNALRLQVLLRELPVPAHPGFIFNLVRWCVVHATQAITNYYLDKPVTDALFTKVNFQWLGATAFHKAFCRRQTKYHAVIALLTAWQHTLIVSTADQSRLRSSVIRQAHHSVLAKLKL
ncbi:Telomerase reverse transcriptase [Dimargaris verticillata]|uniref:Telomerase reverse transcriptase n=1 Tax=Dimargaris verticillata TaxID=2761393 RepID=A0A9W8EF02_9FUNG|nr:Telomerase reverse transcriptase [Dimargaris verticillata]